MKFSKVAAVSTLAMAQAMPLQLFSSLFNRAADTDSISSDPFDSISSYNTTTSSNSTSTTNTTSSTNTTNSTTTSNSSTTELPSIKILSFSSELTALWSSSNSSSSSVSLSIQELYKVLDIKGQDASGNLNSTLVDQSTGSGASIYAYFNTTELGSEVNLTYEQLSSDNSSSNISLALYEALQSEGGDYDAFVVPLDLSYLSDAAFFIQVLTNGSVPVVFTPAVTSSNLLTSGLSNLYDAITVAADPTSDEFGTLVVASKEVVPAFFAERSTSQSQDTIVSSEGNLGRVVEGSVEWFTTSFEAPEFNETFSVDSSSSLPEVVLFESYQSLVPELLDALQSAGVEGVVLSSGSIDEDDSVTQEAVTLADSIPVVFAGTGSNSVTPDDVPSNSTIAAGFLSPEKAKVLLQIGLASDFGTDDLKTLFSTVYGG